MLNKMLTNEFIYDLHPKWNFKQEKTTIICTSTEYLQEFPIKPSIYIYSVYQLGYGNYNNSQTTWKLRLCLVRVKAFPENIPFSKNVIFRKGKHFHVFGCHKIRFTEN